MFEDWMQALGLDDEAVLNRAAQGLPANPQRLPPPARPARPARPPAVANIHMPASPPVIGPAQQAAALDGMVRDVNTAIRRENDSRVAQSREAKRMQHEKEIEKTRLDALLARLQSAQPPARDPRVVEFPGGRIIHG